jgi:hypothetical protein
LTKIRHLVYSFKPHNIKPLLHNNPHKLNMGTL